MNDQDLLQQLFLKRRRFHPKSWSSIEEASQQLGVFPLAYPAIHIAGTNGKGSVATKIAKTLEYSGYRVGLFTSPHIQDFSERIQINGMGISSDEVQSKLAPLMEKFPDFCFFDYVTFLAFQYFKEKKVDVAVFEVGIGGLHDVTNLVTPLVAIITSVSFDHMDMLGSTLDEIAYQKAGIIKPHTPIVIGPKARFSPIFKKSEECHSPLIEVFVQVDDYNEENKAIARAALEQLKHHFAIPEATLEKGLLEKPPCRFERHGRFVLDVAHNPEGIEGLLKTWNLYHKDKRKVAIIGMSLNKDYRPCLKMLAKATEHLFLVQAESSGAASLENLKGALQQERITHFTACQSISEAIGKALSSEHDILICGSFYIMKHARQEIFRLQVS